MNNIEYELHLIFQSLALYTPPFLLLLHLFWQPRRYWLTYLSIAVVVVWFAGSASTYFYHESLWEQIQEYERGAKLLREICRKTGRPTPASP